MMIDSEVLAALFARLGATLVQPTTLCLIGSTPGIATGQADRQTPDVDIWYARSDFDAGDLAQACRKAGILFDPRGELDPDAVYLQIVRPGIVRLPDDFTPETIGRYGNLTVVMPPPEILAAAKLVRGSDVDISDVVWWVRNRGMDAKDIELAISTFPSERDREAASENVMIVRLVMTRDTS